MVDREAAGWALNEGGGNGTAALLIQVDVASGRNR
jgi:hypothetical protein